MKLFKGDDKINDNCDGQGTYSLCLRIWQCWCDTSKFQPHNNIVNLPKTEKKKMFAHLINELMLGAGALTLKVDEINEYSKKEES